MPHLIFLLECRLLFYSWHVLHGQALPGSMSGSLKTILRGSTSRVNLPNAQSNDCGRSPTNDGNGNAASCDLSSGSLNAPPRLWQLPYTKLSPLDGAAMGTDAGQVLASHRLRILRTHAPIHVEQASERLGQQSGLVHPAPGDDTATVSVPSCEFQEQAGLYGLVSALPAGHRPHAAYQGHLVERPYIRSVVYHSPAQRRFGISTGT